MSKRIQGSNNLFLNIIEFSSFLLIITSDISSINMLIVKKIGLKL